MTDQTGKVIDRLGYDAFGERQTLAANSLDLNQQQDVLALGMASTTQGYTGHEMLDEFNLIHMNGRLYDPVTSQFTSADPVVADVMRWQSYNKYAYAEQDPINLLDPTGYSVFSSISRAVRSIFSRGSGARDRAARGQRESGKRLQSVLV